MKNKITLYFVIIILLLLLFSCNKPIQDTLDVSSQSPDQAPDVIYYVTDNPTLLPTDSPTPLPTPTATPTPTPTPTATPTPSPTPEGMIGGKYDVFSYEDKPIQNETSYTSEKVSINISQYAENPYRESKLVYFVIDIYLQNLTALRTSAAKSFEKSNTAAIDKISRSADALVAINGDYYTHIKGLVIRNGVLFRQKIANNRDICLLYKDGTMDTVRAKDIDIKTADFSNVWQAWQFGPYLIEKDGTPRKDFSGYGINPLNPRTVLGYYEPGHYCFVIVEGRRDRTYSAGLTLKDLAKLMVDLGCTKAYNLDGGASSQLYWDGEIYNYPSGKALRPIPDIIYVAEPYSDEESDEILSTPVPSDSDTNEIPSDDYPQTETTESNSDTVPTPFDLQDNTSDTTEEAS